MNIFLVDASPHVRLTLQMLLDSEPGLNVTGLAVKIDGLLAQLEIAQPDVLLLDWSLLRESLDDFLAGLRTLAARPRVIVLRINPDEEQPFPDTELDAVFYKADPPEELMTILREMRDEIGD